MSIHEAEPGDVYVDAIGKLWRVVGICHEPSVIVEEIERSTPRHMVPMRRRGGVSAFMWKDWRRIFRPEKMPENKFIEKDHADESSAK